MLKIIATTISIMCIILLIWKSLDDSDYLGLKVMPKNLNNEEIFKQICGASKEEKNKVLKSYRRWIWENDDNDK